MRFADQDFAALRAAGISTCRDGVSWVRAEQRPGRFDFSSPKTLLHAARRAGVRIIWDLMHFGWPDDIDIFGISFPARFGAYARAFAHFLADAGERAPVIAPINEISFLSWAGADVRIMNPFVSARGVELTVQLVRATIEAIEAFRAILPETRFLQPDPVIHIVPSPEQPKTWRRIEADNLSQYQAWDMLTGAIWPSVGGNPSYLDIVGVNFYPDNQFMIDGTTIGLGDPRYKRFSQILSEVWLRYQRPMIVSETGAEGDARVPWLRYICDESATALQSGVDLHGVTLYPIVNHPGWEAGRRCENGLFDYADSNGVRPVYEPLANELRAQEPRLHRLREQLAARSALPIPA
ncbi:MAG TPA: hypothetical protein VJV79_11295 [Polyangiaceae bacterium]|nr:hypothetical protein [Polyangiaceae bacterium]